MLKTCTKAYLSRHSPDARSACHFLSRRDVSHQQSQSARSLWQVSKADARKALDENFGGEDENPPVALGFGTTPAFKFTKYSNAYMLVYIRASDWHQVTQHKLSHTRRPHAQPEQVCTGLLSAYVEHSFGGHLIIILIAASQAQAMSSQSVHSRLWFFVLVWCSAQVVCEVGKADSSIASDACGSGL